MCKHWFFICVTLFPITIQAQKTLDEIHIIADSLLNNGKWNEGIIWCKKGLELSIKKDEVYYEAAFLHELGVAFQYKEERDTARSYFEKAIVIAEKNNDYTVLGASFRSLASFCIDNGNYISAMNYLLKALPCFENTNDLYGVFTTFNTLGNLQFQREQYDSAIYNYNKALTALGKIPLTLLGLREQNLDKGILFNNMGETYRKKASYDTALIYLRSALFLKANAENQGHLANTQLALGKVYDEYRNYAVSDSFYLQSYSISKQVKNKSQTAEAANAIASLYIKLKKYILAEQYLNESREIASKDTLREILLENYKISKNLYEHKKQFSLALHYADLYTNLKDVLRDEKMNRDIEELKMKFNFENLEVNYDLAIRKKENERQIYLLIAIFLGLTVILVMAGYVKIREGKNKVEILMRELNHRVKNNLQVLSGILSLQHDQLNDETALKVIKETENRVLAMSFIHRKLYKGKEFTSIQFNEFITELTTELMLSYGYNKNTLKMELQLESVLLNVDKALPLGLIINELVSNTFKHAFSHQPSPELFIRIFLKNRQLHIYIKDNGSGLEDPNNIKDSFGYRLIHMLVKQLHATIIISNNNGTEVQLTVPYT